MTAIREEMEDLFHQLDFGPLGNELNYRVVRKKCAMQNFQFAGGLFFYCYCAVQYVTSKYVTGFFCLL